VNRVRRTSALLLLALAGVGLAAGLVVRPLAEGGGHSAPRPGWAAAAVFVLAAGIVGRLAWNTWQSLHQRHERMTSEHGLRMLAVAKASSVVAALFAGGYGGLAISFLDAWDAPLGRERVLHGGAAALAAVLLLVAGLLLERACRIPGDDDENGSGSHAGATPA